jgi:hypothetical protein
MNRQQDLPRHIVWSTDALDLDDPFQRRWYLRQVLLHGRAEDIRKLDLSQVARLLPALDLPSDIQRLWRNYLKECGRG